MRRFIIGFVFFSVSLNGTAQHKKYYGDGPDDYLRLMPVASVFALKMCGVENASSWERLAMNSAASCIISLGVAWGLKYAIHEQRPDGTDNHAFPSGHTTFAFIGAHLLHKEYGRKSIWYSIAGYGVAAAVGIDRVARNRHRWHDVCAGAVIGILGTEVGYWLGDRITGESSRYSLAFGTQSLSFIVQL